MSKKRSRGKRAGAKSERITVMLTLERPPAAALSEKGRGEKYATLKANAAELRDQLLAWLEKRGLAEGVGRVGEPTVFNTLFVTSTREVAQALRQAPGVVDVQPAEEFRVDLLPDARRAPPEEGGLLSPGEEPTVE